MEKQKAQRVSVFVDVQNMYYSARALYTARVNFKNILQDATAGRSLIRASAYVIRTEEIKREPFFEALSRIGYEIKAKDLQVFAGGAKKGDWDVGIAMDAIEQAPKIDTIVLVSGDGDFVPLVEHLRRAMGCRVEVMAFEKSTNKQLKETADSFIDLGKNTRKYLIKTAKKRGVKK